MPLDAVFDYFRSYDKQAFQVVACKGNEPSEADIAAFESTIGFRLPTEFREFTMSGLGGLYMEVREELWPRAKAFDVGPFWSFLYGLKVFGIAREIPEWLDIREQHRTFAEAGPTDLVPFMQIVGDADLYCFDRAGQIIRWSHEEPDARNVEPRSFSALLMHEIRELEGRKDRKLRGEGVAKPLRQAAAEATTQVPQTAMPLPAAAATATPATSAPPPPAPMPAPTLQPPIWVRVGLGGIPSRGFAWVFVGLSIAVAIVCIFWRFDRWQWFWVASSLVAAGWYWACIRWMDRNRRW